MSCFCWKKEDETNTELIVETNKEKHDENNIINNDNKNINSDKKEKFDIERYKNENALEKINKIQSKYRSSILTKKHKLDAKVEILNINIDTLKQRFQELQNKYQVLDNENKSLKEQLNKNNELMQQLENLNNEKKLIGNKIKEYEKISQEQQTAINKLKTVDQENLKIKQQNQLLDKEITSLKKQLEELQKTNNEIQNKYMTASMTKKNINEHEEVYNELQKKINMLQNELQTAQEEKQIWMEKCNKSQETINTTNNAIGKIITIPIKLKETSRTTDNARETSLLAKEKQNNNEERPIYYNYNKIAKYIKTTTNIYSKNKNKDTDTTDKIFNNKSIFERVHYDVENNINKVNVLKNQTNAINFFNRNRQLNNEKANNKNNFSDHTKVFSCFNNKQSNTEINKKLPHSKTEINKEINNKNKVY